MRVIYEAFDGEKFNTEADCLQHEKNSPLFKTYDRWGHPIEVGQGVHLLHIIDGLRAAKPLCDCAKNERNVTRALLITPAPAGTGGITVASVVSIRG